MGVPHIISYYQDGIVILTTPNMQSVAERSARILQHQGIPLEYSRDNCVLDVTEFNDTEAVVDVLPNVRDKSVILFYDFVGNRRMRAFDLMMYLDALKRSNVQRITLIVPYMPFSRQDRKMKRQTFTARMFADMLGQYDRILQHLVTFDLHAPQITGFYDWVNVENIPGHAIFAPYVRERFTDDFFKNLTVVGTEETIMDGMTVVSTDVGGSKRARDFAQAIERNTPVAIIDKRRQKAGESEALNLIGDVSKVALVYDDIGDTLGSLMNACKLVKAHGSETVLGMVTHNVMSKKDGVSAEARLKEAGIELVTANTLPRSNAYFKRHELITPVSYDYLTSEIIKALISVDGSVKRAINTATYG